MPSPLSFPSPSFSYEIYEHQSIPENPIDEVSYQLRSLLGARPELHSRLLNLESASLLYNTTIEQDNSRVYFKSTINLWASPGSLTLLFNSQLHLHLQFPKQDLCLGIQFLVGRRTKRILYPYHKTESTHPDKGMMFSDIPKASQAGSPSSLSTNKEKQESAVENSRAIFSHASTDQPDKRNFENFFLILVVSFPLNKIEFNSRCFRWLW